ncbi:MAG: NAD(P)/FAD-dependent oxidoreductase [Desulfuromonadales bacterium]
MHIAVIGGGVAGIVSAYLLQQKHRVSLFEQNDYIGGHTNTVEIKDGPDSGLAIDTGFIVLNDRTYPLFQRFLKCLDVPTRNSEMSFGYQCRQTGLVYAGNNLNGLFTQRRNLFSPTFYRFLLEIGRFCRQARDDLACGRVPQITLGEYLERSGYSRFMIGNYLLPMAAAIWSTPTLEAADFPAEAFLRFFKNHGLLSFRDRPQWKTVAGGSFTYVKAFQKRFSGEIHVNAGVEKVFRTPEGVRLQFANGHSRYFDKVVIATHADQAVRLLGDASTDERRLLSPWHYQRNHTVLHTDSRLLPDQKSAWAAWNFTREAVASDSLPVFVTYYMNRLQGLQARQNYCVTLNYPRDFRPETVIARFDYQHPQYTVASLATQADLPRLNGQQHSWFCGSYFGYGFHEDAVRSAVAVANDFGVSL